MTDKRPFYGWWVLGALTFFSLFGAGTVWYGFTAYFDPLVDHFGWSYTAISVAVAVRGVETGAGGLFVGFLVDRFGGRKIVFAGTLLMTAGFLLLSRVNSLPTFYIYYFIISLGVTSGGTVVALPILSHWFEGRIGTAFGLFAVGGGLSGFIVPVVVYLVDSVGFRMTFVIFGCSALVVGGLAAMIVRERPRSTVNTVEGGMPAPNEHADAVTRESVVSAQSAEAELTLKSVLRNRVFWVLALMFATHMFALQMISTHVMPFLESIGFARNLAGQGAMMVPVFSMVGRLAFGWIGDRMNRLGIVVAVMLMQAVGAIALAFVGSHGLVVVFLMVYSLGYGGLMPNRAALLHDYFGAKLFASLLGLLMGPSLLLGIAGPVSAGWFFDNNGSYQISFIISAGLLVLGTVPLLTIKKPVVYRRA